MASPIERARRYVGWLERRWAAICVATALILVGSGFLIATRLPLRADFSYLLPQDAAAVRDLRRLEARTKVRDTILVIVQGTTPADRAAAARDMATGIRAIGPSLVEQVYDDDADVRAFFREHRHLFVPLADLERGRDALAARLASEKAMANPLNIDFDDEDDGADAATAAKDEADLAALRKKRDEAEAKLARSGHVSTDDLVQRITVRTAFNRTKVDLGTQLVGKIDALRGQVERAYPGVQIGAAGGMAVSVVEHDALVHGMVLSSLITALLVGLVLILYLRSGRLLVMVSGTLVVGTVVSFGTAALTVGHLNAATAFLGAIIAGNGVNYGIIIVARYQEERLTHEPREALAIALAATLKPTLVASLAASIAYGSLAGTSFRGFADFALIGGFGMVICWAFSFVLLPALMVRFGQRARLYRGDPFLGGLMVKVFGFRRPAVVLALATLLALASAVVVYRYVANDPFEYDMKRLRSEGSAALEARHWMKVADDNFGRGIAGKTYIAADRADQVPRIVAALRKLDDGIAEPDRTIGTVQSILDAVPQDQAKRLAVLQELRTLLDDPLLEQLDAKDLAELKALRPPDDLTLIDPRQVPGELADQLTEQDGSIGKLIAVRPALALDEWNGRDLIRFAAAVRRLKLDDGETITTSGTSVIFADIIKIIRADGPLVTGMALVGLVIMVFGVVGLNRRAVAVLVATSAGTLTMVAACALLDLKVNFLDFVALPITLGLGVDYAINLAHRQHHDGADPLEPLRTSGAAVFMCSLTTIIGYGSLLVSQNLAIRGFGLASLIGEITCLLAALVMVPALISVGKSRRAA